MHCIVMSSPNNTLKGNAGWHIHRSVEVLAYHQAAECVKILFLVLAENLLDGPNVLRFLHRGNVQCRLICPSYPLPRHPDEEYEPQQPGILESVYGKAFNVYGACVREHALTPWEAWARKTRQSVTLFGGNELKNDILSPEFDVPEDDSYIPFCTWKLEDFKNKGLYLISFSLEFSGETYKRLVASDESFSVDGPQRLLSAIKYRDIPDYRNEQRNWLDRLRAFEDEATAVCSDSYDVIILGSPLADEVNICYDRCCNGIHKAAQNQPAPDCHAVRYVTTDQFFTLPLSYVETHAELALAAG
jgi:hypothetical protein